MSRRAATGWIALIALLTCARIAATYRVFSQTVDEPTHIAAGFQWVSTSRYDLELEHPPLARIGFALGSLAAHAKARTDLPAGEQGTELLFTNGDYQHNLALARAGNLPWFVLAMFVVALWANSLFGPAAAIAAAALFSFLTPVLAHAGLATTDMGACATVAAALYAFDRWLAERRWKRTLLLAVAIGVGLVAKMSFAFFFVPGAMVIAGACVVARLLCREGTPRPRNLATPQLLATLFLVPLLIIWAAYKFDVGTLNHVRVVAMGYDSDPQVAARYAETPGYDWVRSDLVYRYHRYTGLTRGGFVDFVDWAKHAGYPSPLAGRNGRDTMIGQPPVPPVSLRDRALEPPRAAFQWLSVHMPLPAPMFFAGLQYVGKHSSGGHSAYFFGHYSTHGWWYYFPALLLLKTPVAFLILFAIGAVLVPRFGVVTLAMLVFPMISGINIGIRHVLPVYVPMTLAAAAALIRLWRGSSLQRSAFALLAVWLVVANVRAHPDYLADFNELAGSHPEHIATDSNFDWGQDELRLIQYARKQHLAPLHIAYFGNLDPRRFGLVFDDLGPDEHVRGWVAITEMKMIFGPPDNRGGGYKWLQAYPYRRIGKSIRLYNLP
jgi:4-amino-4-deoxy-L-arabinose transferase-like glycosyltransferase